MLYLLVVLSLLSCNEGFSFSPRSLAVRTPRAVTQLNAIAKARKAEDVSSKTVKKITKKVVDDVEFDREALMLDIVTQLMEKMGELEKGGDESGQSSYSSSLSTDQTELLNGVIRVYCTHSQPNFGMPWQRMKQEFSTSTGFVIDGDRILTNAHAVEYGSLIQVKKRSSEKKYVASVIAGTYVLNRR